MKLRKVLLMLFAVVFAYSNVYALSHFSFTEGDPTNSMVITLNAASNPTLDGTTLATGDEIGMFNQNGDCVGAVVWENAATYITAWGVDGSTPGYQAGESLMYRVWDASADKEYDNISVVHWDIDDNVIAGEFNNTLPYIYINSFAALTTPTTPMLTAPADMATGIYLSGNLEWDAVLNADSYSVMVSTTSDFSSDIVVDETGLTSTQYPYTLAEYNTTYYWKVMATDDTDGDSEWSETWSFTTYNGATKDVEVTLYLNGIWNGNAHQPVAVSIELRTGDQLKTSTVVDRKPALLDASGTGSANFGQVADGDYWMIVRATGYLPLAAPAKVSLSTSGVTYNFTTASTQAVGGASAMIQNTSSLWEARGGDLNFDRNVAAFDVPILVNSLGKNVSSQIPAP